MVQEMLELRYEETLGYYTSPLQMKANNGLFIIDDFGRQMINPRDLLIAGSCSTRHRLRCAPASSSDSIRDDSSSRRTSIRVSSLTRRSCAAFRIVQSKPSHWFSKLHSQRIWC
jgi:hypothetical protein